MKKIVSVLLVVLMMFFLTVFMYGFSDREDKKQRVKDFIESYGWKTDGFCGKETVLIPSPLNDVYIKYNEIQKKTGFDLNMHCGDEAERYTYKIINHKMSDSVFANVIVKEGEIISADIMTRNIDGFMHEINRKEYIK